MMIFKGKKTQGDLFYPHSVKILLWWCSNLELSFMSTPQSMCRLKKSFICWINIWKGKKKIWALLLLWMFDSPWSTFQSLFRIYSSNPKIKQIQMHVIHKCGHMNWAVPDKCCIITLHITSALNPNKAKQNHREIICPDHPMV